MLCTQCNKARSLKTDLDLCFAISKCNKVGSLKSWITGFQEQRAIKSRSMEIILDQGSAKAQEITTDIDLGVFSKNVQSRWIFKEDLQ